MSSFNPSAVASASNLSNPSSSTPTPSPSASFNADGFYISPTPLLTPSETTSLRTSLESLIRHSYPSSTPPTKPCKKINAPRDPQKPLGFTGNLQNTKTLQIVNTHLSNPSISSILRSPTLASYIGHLTNWPSVRYIQDQAWLKPPNAPSLSFHRDRPYIPLKRELTENDLDGGYHKNVRIVTLWITLDDIEEDSGGLEFAVGSHTWLKTSEEGYPVGANSSFFGGEDYRYMASKMGKDEGVEVVEFKETVGLKAGGGSFHDGDTYHGSGVNRSKTLPRRGIGIHFSRGDVEWDVEKAKGSKVWKEFVEGVEEGGEAKLSEEDFPIVWTRKTEGEWEEEIKSEKPSIKTALKNLMTNR
ncbi:hypothetical protein TrLO_g13320 [Triparma laevis f. longispina]|nr:hypothetical protein TrLO_g13320 [Triparma laevis f. longispina]